LYARRSSELTGHLNG
jgi:cold shock protein